MRRFVTGAIGLASQTRNRAGERGQVIVLFTLFLVALLGIGAFVLDVARVYTLQRYERSVADAAALAGAQDLQDSPTSRVQTTSKTYPKAVNDALSLLGSQLAGTSTPPTCTLQEPSGGLNNTNSDYVYVTGCQVGDYSVSVKVPSPSYVNVDPRRAVQVTVQANVPMTLARLFGQNTWNVGQTSVAGLRWAPQYAVITLQPPNPKNNGSDANLCKDLVVDGNNTVLNVLQGDVGTNTSAATTNAGLLTLADGYYVDHYDDLTGASCGVNTDPTWTLVNGDPQGKQIHALIPDPRYTYPFQPGATPTFTSQSQGLYNGTGACTGAPGFPNDPRVPAATTTCYNPGIYDLGPNGNQVFSVGSSDTVYLLPGGYYFESGLTVNGSLYGGLVSDKSLGGVVLQFPESAKLSANNAINFVLNVGTCTGVSDSGCNTAYPALVGGKPVETTAGLVLSIMVDTNTACFLGGIPQDNSGCEISSIDNTVNLAGSGSLQVAGVIYGPSDQMSINGNSAQTGYVGQIYSWTVTYTGGSTLDQSYPGEPGNGILSLDAACSGPIGFGLGGVGSGGPNFCNP